MINLKKDDAVADVIREILQQEALKGDQHKIDANKNNKIDAHDFKLLRGKKKGVEEEVKDEYARKVDKYLKKKHAPDAPVKEEELDENSAPRITGGEGGLGNNPHLNDLHRPAKAAPSYIKQQLLARKSKGGVAGPKGKLPEENVKEDVEQLDELSKSTLGSYTKKASRDATITRKIGADFENNAKRSRSPGMKAAANSLSDKYKSKSWKRKAGIDKAVDRLTKEDVEGVKLKTLSQFKEGWSEMMADVKKRAEPQPSGGSGIKQGSRYGGSKQKPEKPEEEKKK